MKTKKFVYARRRRSKNLGIAIGGNSAEKKRKREQEN